MAKKRVGKFPKVFRQMAVDRLTQCIHGNLRTMDSTQVITAPVTLH